MGNASYIQDSFAGGEKSQLAQGRITDREYRTWMNVCVNGHPTEAGGWVRRSGTIYAGHTRGGAIGRVIKWDFAAATAYTMEFTNGFIRFRQGLRFATTNDAQTVLAISSANPTVIQTAGASGWATGNTVIFSGDMSTVPSLANRQFTITAGMTVHFSLQDALTGANIDGSTLTLPPGTLTVSRIQEVSSPYVVGSWATVRVVQAEMNAVLLQGTIATQLLTGSALQSVGTDPIFSLAPLTFLDGPYLDPFVNGVQATPSALKGNITLALAFPQFDSGKAYKVGDFVTSVSINYISLIDANVGNTPAGSPFAWQTTNACAAINNGQGFLGTDVGRLVRLFSEPAAWNSATAYVVGNIVSYNPSGAPGASTYWTSLTSNTNKIPGNDTTNWQLTPGNAAIWSWGKINGLNNQISQSLAGSVNFGDMAGGGGLAAAFDGVIVQTASASAEKTFSSPPHAVNNQTSFVGKNYSGASNQKIQQAVIYPSSDSGFVVIPSAFFGNPVVILNFISFNLRGKASVPASSADGTLLATTGSIGNGTSPVTLTSNDQATAWAYVWIEQTTNFTNVSNLSQSVSNAMAEVQFFNPSGTGTGNAVSVEIPRPSLLYTVPIITWRLGAYSNTTGWPTCGTYHEGRIWLGGAIGNRFDASVSNGLVGTTLNFAPTDQNGVVGAANSIAGTVNSDGVNPIFWFTPDLQGIIMGTQAGEGLIAPSAAGAMSAANISARRVTKIGCANVEPRKTDHTNVFVQRYSRKVMEYFTDVYSGKFAAPNLAKDALHITKPGVAELAYSQAVVPII